MPDWLIWAIVALALAAGEIFTPGLFFLGPVALAAVVAMLVAILGAGAVIQVIVFIVGAVASLALVRPIAKIETIFKAIHDGDADPKLLAYQYLQVLPQIAQGESNKVWIIPSEFTQALGQLSDALPRGNSTDESQ